MVNNLCGNFGVIAFSYIVSETKGMPKKYLFCIIFGWVGGA